MAESSAPPATGMSVGAWRASRVNALTLPSGLTVTVRRLEMSDLLLLGHVPMPLLTVLDELAAQPSAREMITYAQTHPEFMDLMTRITRAVVVAPRIVDGEASPADADSIRMDEIPPTDRLAIYNAAQGGVAPLLPFLAGTGTSERAGDAGGTVSQTPE